MDCFGGNNMILKECLNSVIIYTNAYFSYHSYR